MKNILGSNRILPLELDISVGHDSHRIGGFAPEGLIPSHPNSRYLLTLGLDFDWFVSIFLKYDGSYYDSNVLSLNGEGDAIEVMFHHKRPRRRDNSFASDLSPHALEIGNEKADEYRDEEDLQVPYSGNKLGGEAYSLHNLQEFEQVVKKLKFEGFKQFLQLDVGALSTPNIYITQGELPFGYGMFHLFLKPSVSGYEWRCFWQN